MGLSSLFVPLLYHRFLDLSSTFFFFFFQLSVKARGSLIVSALWEFLPRTLSLTDKGIISHPEADCNRQIAQIRDKIFVQFFARFCLTNWPGHGIMEISARTCAPGRPLYHIMQDLSIGNLHKNFHPKNGVKF